MTNPPMPDEARALLPLADVWGNPDEVYRSIKVEDAAPQDLRELVEQVRVAGQGVYDWLEVSTDWSDPDYVALTWLTMAAEEARVILDRSKR